MTNGALAILVHGGTENWSPQRWRSRFDEVCRDRRILLRQEPYLRQSQREKRWAPKFQWPAGAISVGIMGLGTLGANAAEVLRRLGFRVAGWSRGPRRIDGVQCFHGTAQLSAFLRQTDIL